jgi:hypothetical protein
VTTKVYELYPCLGSFSVKTVDYHGTARRPPARRTPEMKEDGMATLTMHCDGCDEPVVGELGYISVDLEAVKECEREAAQSNSQNGGRVDGPNFISAPGSRLRLAPWRICHLACDPDPSNNSYSFDISRGCTERDLLVWTLSLLEKEWLKYTDWRFFIICVLEANKRQRPRRLSTATEY